MRSWPAPTSWNSSAPSFWVSPDKQFYHCFGCGAHGTAIGFLMQYEKLEFQDAILDLAQRAGLEVPREARSAADHGGTDLYDILSRASRFFEQTLADDARGREYLRKRGIDAPTAASFALGLAPDSWNALLNRFGTEDAERRGLLQAGLIIEREARGRTPEPGAPPAAAGAADAKSRSGYYDRFRDRLMFPIRDSRGRVLAFGGRILGDGEPKYLNSPETSLFHKGRELYGLYEARRAHADFKRLMVVEGYMDVVRLHQAGIHYAVATLGTATTQEHLNKIFRLTSEVVFCFDGDRAGRQAAWRALENALPLARDGRELKFLFLPDGHDPDSLVGEEGAPAFEDRLKSCLPLSEYLIQQLLQQVDLTHVDGRAKLAALARPLFTRMPEGVYRELLADRLAGEIHMPAAKLKELLIAGTPRSGTERGPWERAEGSHGGAGRSDSPGEGRRRASPPGGPVRGFPAGEPRHGGRGPMSVGRGNLLRQAITLVLHHPAAARTVPNPDLLGTIDQPGVAVLKELLVQAVNIESPSTAVLLERWRDRPEYARLAELAMTEPLATADAAGAELQMAVHKLLEEYGPRRRMDELLRKAEELGLNYQEKAELSALLQSKSRPGAS